MEPRGAEDESVAEQHIRTAAPKTVTITSPAFTPGGTIPRKYSCQGEDVSPPLDVDGVPAEARALAVIMDDPDAPRGTFTHWVAWNIAPDVGGLPEGVDVSQVGGEEGKNDFNESGYRGPCPPSGAHRYFVRVYALRERLDLPRGARRRELEDALAGRVVSWGETMATYEKV